MAISQNTALFSLLGTTYGGDGTIELCPAQSAGQGADVLAAGAGVDRSMSSARHAGEPTVTLLATQMPAHSHRSNADTSTGTSKSPAGNLPAIPARQPAPASPDVYDHAAERLDAGWKRAGWLGEVSRTTICSPICYLGHYTSELRSIDGRAVSELQEAALLRFT